jgi:hypothetical protein
MSRKAKLDADCRRKQELRINESREDCEKRRRLERERFLARSSNATDDELKARRILIRERFRKRVNNETNEQREGRNKKRRDNETNEQREARNRKRRDRRQCLKLNNNKGFNNLCKLKKRRVTRYELRYVMFD